MFRGLVRFPSDAIQGVNSSMAGSSRDHPTPLQIPQRRYSPGRCCSPLSAYRQTDRPVPLPVLSNLTGERQVKLKRPDRVGVVLDCAGVLDLSSQLDTSVTQQVRDPAFRLPRCVHDVLLIWVCPTA